MPRFTAIGLTFFSAAVTALVAAAVAEPVDGSDALAEVCADSADSVCTPFFACFDDREFAIGRALGAERGALTATTSDGRFCEGTWSRDAEGGVANGACLDAEGGREIRFAATFVYTDPATAAAVATGSATGDGGEMRFEAISGGAVHDFLQSGHGPLDASWCGGAGVS